jgi:hypothetical protein
MPKDNRKSGENKKRFPSLVMLGLNISKEWRRKMQ